jgi:hypothetical protein
MNNVTDNADSEEMRLYFGWLDFSVFGIMLGFSALIGIYFGFCDKKQESRVDYLFGGKTMKTLPVAVSLVARSVVICGNRDSLTGKHRFLEQDLPYFV